MRIAQISPLFESVPPRQYGGTERIVSYLTEELVRRRHDVTLYASGDSRTRAELVPIVPRALRLDGQEMCWTVHAALQLERVLADADQFDILHFHIDHIHYPIARRVRTASLTTLHGRLDLPELQPLYREFRDVPVVSISDSQRRPLPDANWVATVYHGLPAEMFECRERPRDYFAFVGRIAPEKRVDRAIQIAQRAGLPLLIAAKVGDQDREYYESEIRPLLRDARVKFIGEINDEQKNDFIGHARALLFPIDWPEPFGLVMIEALACGTPVIAWPCGSVPEILEDGVTGYIVDSPDAAVQAARHVGRLDRRRVRAVFEQRFTAARMAGDYLHLYRELSAGQARPAPRAAYVQYPAVRR